MCFALVVAFAASCEKNEIEYKTTDIGNVAEFQLHYYNPVAAATANYIYKVEVNGSLIANSTAPLTTYNAIPNGLVGRFYTTPAGSTNIKMYMGTALTTPVYDKTVTLKEGKQNVFVYDFAKDPIVFDNGYPYSTNLTMDSDSTCWVKFYNFLYEKAGEPTTLKLQYQYIDTRTKALVNVGKPVAFGETTGWQPVKVIKSLNISEGYAKIDYRIKVVDASGAVTGDLQLWNASKVYASYADFGTLFIGRRYHLVIAGMRSAIPIASIRPFTAL